jgi:predicted nucleic acid-binding protein
MSVEFVDTNLLVYAHDGGAGAKHAQAVALLARLFEEGTGALSIQVLAEFYAAATRKLGMTSAEAEAVIRDLGGWIIHRPAHADLLKAAQLARRHRLGWWDALILTSAIELGCAVLWTEDFSDGRRFGPVTVRNPFR